MWGPYRGERQAHISLGQHSKDCHQSQTCALTPLLWLGFFFSIKYKFVTIGKIGLKWITWIDSPFVLQVCVCHSGTCHLTPLTTKGTLKKNQEFRICSQKGGGSRPIRNSYFDLVSEDSMLTGSPNQENEHVFRWFRTCFSDENSQIKHTKKICLSK